MMPYIDEMVEALDRPGKMNDYDTIISGTGIAYGTYKPQYRSAESMLEVIEETGISSGPLDSTIRLDPKTGMFYFNWRPEYPIGKSALFSGWKIPATKLRKVCARR